MISLSDGKRIKVQYALASFLAGIIFALSLYGLFQDSMGLDGYVKYATDHWVSGKISIPIEIFMVVLSLVLLWLCRWVEKEMSGVLNMVKDMLKANE
jgi:hypothetical protein